jgi:hypothetical protein
MEYLNPRSVIMSRLLKLLIPALIFGLFLAACGGGGGDGDTTTSDYTGLTTPAVITEENADVLAREAFDASDDDFAADDILLGVETVPDDPSTLPRTLILAQILSDQVKTLPLPASPKQKPSLKLVMAEVL